MPRRVSAGVLLVVGCLALGFVGLVVSSNRYDRYPRDRPNSYYRTRLTRTVVLDTKSPILKSVVDIAAFLSCTRGDRERPFDEQLQNVAAFAKAAPPASPQETP